MNLKGLRCWDPVARCQYDCLAHLDTRCQYQYQAESSLFLICHLSRFSQPHHITISITIAKESSFQHHCCSHSSSQERPKELPRQSRARIKETSPHISPGEQGKRDQKAWPTTCHREPNPTLTKHPSPIVKPKQTISATHTVHHHFPCSSVENSQVMIS